MHRAYYREELVDTALGNIYPDLVIKGGKLVNVHTHEIYPADVIIKGERIAAVGLDEYEVGPDTVEIDATGKLLIPGLMDPHFHLESTSLSVTQLARVIVPRGVTSVVEDPHEIANVLGIKGIKLLFQEAKNLPLNFFLRVPGQVPAVPEIETSGGKIDLEETKEMLQWDEAVCLAGDINPLIILSKNKKHFEKMDFTIQLGKTIGGQSPSLKGKVLNAFIAAGPEDSHVSYDTEEVVDIVRHGMRATLTPRPFQFRPADFHQLASLINNHKIDSRLLMLCTDDRQADLLVYQGHLDDVVRMAIREGIDPITVIQMATINVAENLRLDRDYGSISPGKIADIVLLDELESLKVSKVLYHGKLVAQDGSLVTSPPQFDFPKWSKQTMHMNSTVKVDDFQIRIDEKYHSVDVRVLLPGLPKGQRIDNLQVVEGVVIPDQNRDILSMAVLDRHLGSGNVGKCFVGETGIKDGAIASSVSHDAHNIFVIGSEFEAMAIAVNRVIENEGGFVLVKGNEIIDQIKLPIAGLISDLPYEEVSSSFQQFEWKLVDDLGCKLSPLPLYWLSLISLPNIPELGITDRGLVDLTKIEIISPVLL